MRRIQYIWVEKYKVLKNFDINFNTKYDISYNKKNNKLTIINKKSEYISSFYGKNVELSALVGNNGVGKTTILKLVKTFSFGDDVDVSTEGNYLFIFDNLDNDSLEIVYKAKKPIVCTNVKTELIKHEKYKGKTRDIKNSFKYIYASSSPYDYISSFIDETIITPTSLLSKILNNRNEKNLSCLPYGVFNEYEGEEIKKQIKFITDKGKKMSEYFFVYPKELEISLLTRTDDEQNNILHIKEYINKIKCGTKTNHFGESMCKEIIKNLYSIETIRETIENEVKKTKGKIEINNFLNRIVHNSKAKDADIIEGYIKFINYYKNNVCKSKMIQKNDEFSITMRTTNIKEKINFDVFLKFHNMYDNLKKEYHFLEVRWGLSSGEKAILELFANLYDSLTIGRELQTLSNKCNDKPANNVCLLLDEVELFLHPSWQRKYICSIIEFVKDNFKNSNVQIIISSHSPIILSDVLKQNTVYIRECDNTTKVDINTNHKETFGSNIYTLYNDAFFLDDGPIGLFSEKTIINLIREIQSKKGNREELIKKVKLIGDDVMRKKLTMLIKTAREHND